MYNTIIKKQKFIYITYSILIICGLYPLQHDKVETFIILNKYHNKFLDTFFYYISTLGHTAIYIPIIITLAIKKSNPKNIITVILTFLAVAITVQIVKMITYSKRPIDIIPLENKLKILVEGIKYTSKSTSLPSGHAAIIFSISNIISTIYNTKWYNSTLMLILSITVAYSRIYLGHHFYIDTYIGAIIGIIASTITTHKVINSKYKI